MKLKFKGRPIVQVGKEKMMKKLESRKSLEDTKIMKFSLPKRKDKSCESNIERKRACINFDFMK